MTGTSITLRKWKGFQSRGKLKSYTEFSYIVFYMSGNKIVIKWLESTTEVKHSR